MAQEKILFNHPKQTITMARKTIKENKFNLMRHHTGTTKFTGCQCFKDCSCNDDFKPSNYDYYSVLRKNKKTTIHKTLQEAEERWIYVNNLTLNKQ